MSVPAANPDGHLARNIVHFARALRRAGLTIGMAEVHDAIRAVARAGFTRRADFHVILRAIFVTRTEDRAVFAQVFDIFWRDPGFIETTMQALMPTLEREPAAARAPRSAERRAREAMMPDTGRQAAARPRAEVELDGRFSISDLERLGQQDFEQMSAEELAEAEAAIKSLRLPIAPLPSRRRAPHQRGAFDPRGALRAARRRGGEILSLPRRAPRPRPPKLVLLVDISGSMSAYSRMMLLFAHALKTARHRPVSDCHVFTFGTRLTNVTRTLASKDADRALADVGGFVRDWRGGTAIGANLDRFVKDWARRVLGTDALVVLVSDGLERGDPARLSGAAERLRLSCRRLVWMNPLLRYDGFAPEAGGIAALLPHVDHFIGAHNLNGIADLAMCLSADRRDAGPPPMPSRPIAGPHRPPPPRT